MTNTNAVVSDNAIAQTTMQSADTQQIITESMVGEITTLFDRTLEQLVVLRDSAHASAIAALEHESSVLAVEYSKLETAIHDIEATLPARIRITQHEVDILSVSDKADAKQEAANKRAELAEFKNKPVVMRQRMSEIQGRFLALDGERQAVTRTIFEQWHRDVVQPTVRAAEHGLFCVLLDGLARSFSSFQDQVGMGTADNKRRTLLNQSHFSNLTSDGRSEEWAAGHKWYG